LAKILPMNTVYLAMKAGGWVVTRVNDGCFIAEGVNGGANRRSRELSTSGLLDSLRR